MPDVGVISFERQREIWNYKLKSWVATPQNFAPEKSSRYTYKGFNFTDGWLICNFYLEFNARGYDNTLAPSISKVWSIHFVGLFLRFGNWLQNHKLNPSKFPLYTHIIVIPLRALIWSLRVSAKCSFPTVGLLKASQRDETVGKSCFGGHHFNHWWSISCK